MSRLRQKDLDPIRHAAEQAQSVRATSSLNPSTSGPMGAASLILHRNSYPIENALRGLDERLDAIDGGGLPGEGEPGVGGELDTLQDNLDLVEFNGGYRPPYRAEWRTIISALSSQAEGNGFWLVMKVRKILVYCLWPPAYWTSTATSCSCAPFPPIYDVDLVTDLRCNPDAPNPGQLEKHIESVCGVFGYTAEPEEGDAIMCVESCQPPAPMPDTTSEVAEVPAHGVLMETPALSNIWCDDATLFARFRTVYVHALGAESDWIRIFVCECGVCPEECSGEPEFLFVDFPTQGACGGNPIVGGTLRWRYTGACIWDFAPGNPGEPPVIYPEDIACIDGFWLLKLFHPDMSDPFITYRKGAVLEDDDPTGTYYLFDPKGCTELPPELILYGTTGTPMPPGTPTPTGS